MIVIIVKYNLEKKLYNFIILPNTKELYCVCIYIYIYIYIYIHFINISQYYCFNCIFDQNKCSLENLYFFQTKLWIKYMWHCFTYLCIIFFASFRLLHLSSYCFFFCMWNNGVHETNSGAWLNNLDNQAVNISLNSVRAPLMLGN